jgi:hypothetical protein
MWVAILLVGVVLAVAMAVFTAWLNRLLSDVKRLRGQIHRFCEARETNSTGHESMEESRKQWGWRQTDDGHKTRHGARAPRVAAVRGRPIVGAGSAGGKVGAPPRRLLALLVVHGQLPVGFRSRTSTSGSPPTMSVMVL